MLKKTVFTICDEPIAYIGFTEGKLWNGWATPYFEKAEADKVMEEFNECAEFPMQYDEVYDQFYNYVEGYDDYEFWKGADYVTTEGIKHLYGIGAYCWIWDAEEIKPISEGIADLFLDYDHEIAEEFITEQLKDFNKLRSAIEILRDDETAEIKMQKLREELIIMKIGQIIAINGNLFEYGGIENAEYSKGKFHKVYEIDVDEEGILTATSRTWYFIDEELKNDTIEFTKSQWYGIVEHFIRQDYDYLTEEEINDAVDDIVCREFAYGRPKTIEELQKHIAAHMKR
jgi:hypothetical protein